MDIKSVRAPGSSYKNIRPFRTISFPGATLTPDTDEPDVVNISIANPGMEDIQFVSNPVELAAAMDTDGNANIVLRPSDDWDMTGWATQPVVDQVFRLQALATVTLTGTGAETFARMTSGALTLENINFDQFAAVVTFNDNTTDEIDLLRVNRCQVTNSTDGGLIAFFPSTKGPLIDRFECTDTKMLSVRQGIHARFRFNYAKVTGCEVGDFEAYGIRLGKDTLLADANNLTGHAHIHDNNVHDAWNDNAEFEGGFETNGIAAFCLSATITDNDITDLDNFAGDDCEGIYVKCRQFTITGNTLTNAGDAEGSIIAKGHHDETGLELEPLLQRASVIANNTVRWTRPRNVTVSHPEVVPNPPGADVTVGIAGSVGINCQHSNTNIVGNTIEGATVKGIWLGYQILAENINISNNIISMARGTDLSNPEFDGTDGIGVTGIGIWFYGRNNRIHDNVITGSYDYGITVAGVDPIGDPTNFRYPYGDAVIVGGGLPYSDGLQIYNNTIHGDGTTSALRGIHYAAPAATNPLHKNVRIKNNEIYGFYQYGVAINAAGSHHWTIFENDLHDNTVDWKFFTVPNNLRIGGKGFENAGTDTISSASTSKTRAHGIQGDIAAVLSAADFSIDASSAWGSATKMYLGTIGTTNFQTLVDMAPGSGLNYSWKCRITREIP